MHKHHHIIPKMRFCLWQATLGKLKTKEMLQQRERWNDGLCVLCNSADETHQHLFLSCDFRVVRAAFLRCGIDISARSLRALLDFIMSTDSTTPQGSVMSLVIANVTWQLWKERCDRRPMRWLEPGFLLNQRSPRDSLMDRPDRIRLLEWKQR